MLAVKINPRDAWKAAPARARQAYIANTLIVTLWIGLFLTAEALNIVNFQPWVRILGILIAFGFLDAGSVLLRGRSGASRTLLWASLFTVAASSFLLLSAAPVITTWGYIYCLALGTIALAEAVLLLTPAFRDHLRAHQGESLFSAIKGGKPKKETATTADPTTDVASSRKKPTDHLPSTKKKGTNS